jgi:SAM-dependent methyltransferase
LAGLWDGKVEIRQGLLEEVELQEKFDIVLFLNVLHHVKDPVPVIRKLASLCRGSLIVEFRQPHDPQFVVECFHQSSRAPGKRSLVQRGARRLRVKAEARMMEWATKRLPIIGVGSVEYHRSYFFSEAGFRNMFQVHNGLFRSVEFRPSRTRGQTLAICDCT